MCHQTDIQAATIFFFHSAQYHSVTTARLNHYGVTNLNIWKSIGGNVSNTTFCPRIWRERQPIVLDVPKRRCSRTPETPETTDFLVQQTNRNQTTKEFPKYQPLSILGLNYLLLTFLSSLDTSIGKGKSAIWPLAQAQDWLMGACPADTLTPPTALYPSQKYDPQKVSMVDFLHCRGVIWDIIHYFHECLKNWHYLHYF